jgi:hypothetical protein
MFVKLGMGSKCSKNLRALVNLKQCGSFRCDLINNKRSYKFSHTLMRYFSLILKLEVLLLYI